MKPSLARAAALALLLVPAGAMTAIAAAPASIIKIRHENFEAMGRAMKGTVDQLKAPAPDFAVIRANAGVLAAAATKVGGHFPRGTGPESGLKTDALPTIWQRPADFAAASRRLVETTKALQVAAQSNDPAKVRAAFGAVGGSCKNCHDSFRKPRG